jgi:hypothetical protein
MTNRDSSSVRSNRLLGSPSLPVLDPDDLGWAGIGEAEDFGIGHPMYLSAYGLRANACVKG